MKKHIIALHDLTKFIDIVIFDISSNIFQIITRNFYLLNLMYFLKNSSSFRCLQLLDLFALDRVNAAFRFEINYLLLSLDYNFRVLIKVYCHDNDSIYSVSQLFSSAVWLEREVWDLFGVWFLYNIDLRRILTDYGFSGHPLRKDFPLTGFFEIRYDETIKSITLNTLELSQDFRFFDVTTSWVNKN